MVPFPEAHRANLIRLLFAPSLSHNVVFFGFQFGFRAHSQQVATPDLDLFYVELLNIPCQ